MKSNILSKAAVALAAVATLAGCSENSWNDQLDGFENALDKPVTDKRDISYTLTAADYKAIADNATNKALAKAEGTAAEAALKAVGTRQSFSELAPADKYLPAFLGSKSFAYFTLTDGSIVKFTYNEEKALPKTSAEVAAATVYTVSDDNFKQLVWEDEDNFVSAFTPSKPASKFIPAILAKSVAEPTEGQYCYVSYRQSDQDPVFGTAEPGNKWAPTKAILPTLAVGDALTCQAVVTAVCQQGYIITDDGGSILVYIGKTFDPTTVTVGQQVNVSGTISAYNGGLQVSATDLSVEVVGTQAVKYPTAKVYTQEDLDALAPNFKATNHLAEYAQITGKVVVSGSNVNILLTDGATVQGSVYQGTAAQKAAFTADATVTLKGYFIAVASAKFCNFVVTEVNGKAVTPARRRAGYKAPLAPVPTQVYNNLYQYSGDKWVVPSGFYTLSTPDYTAMGQKYSNLSNPNELLPIFMNQKFAYSANGSAMNVVYMYYSSAGTAVKCDPYQRLDNAWSLNTGRSTVTNQFIRANGKWMFDPGVYITLAAAKGDAVSSKYYQACVDWVFENICKPLGDDNIKSGKFYVSSYGNNEYYSGTSAYQNNVDLRGDKAIEQYPAGYEGMTKEQVVVLMKKRFMTEVMPGALATLHPNAEPVPGVETVYTITFGAYNGATTDTYVGRWKLVSKGKFEAIDCTWDK